MEYRWPDINGFLGDLHVRDARLKPAPDQIPVLHDRRMIPGAQFQNLPPMHNHRSSDAAARGLVVSDHRDDVLRGMRGHPGIRESSVGILIESPGEPEHVLGTQSIVIVAVTDELACCQLAAAPPGMMAPVRYRIMRRQAIRGI